jgi:hypothetical protein
LTSGPESRTSPTYRDPLVEISPGSILFQDYYFPTMRPKRVPLASISKVEVRRATIWNGKWRIHGTGNLRTWYPLDRKRPSRDRVFLATLLDQWVRIGFTVERPDDAIQALESLGVRVETRS